MRKNLNNLMQNHYINYKIYLYLRLAYQLQKYVNKIKINVHY